MIIFYNKFIIKKYISIYNMKCSMDLYLIIFILIFFMFKNNNSDKKVKTNKIKENFSNNLKDSYKSGKYTQNFNYYKTANTGNNFCQDRLIGSKPSAVNAEAGDFKMFNIVNAQHYEHNHSGGSTIVHNSNTTGTDKCRRQNAIYLDERFPEKPYAALNSTQYINSTSDKPAEPSLNYQKNVPEKNKMNDYVVVPLPNVSEDGDSYTLDDPTYVLLRYKNKPINTNYGGNNVGATGSGDMYHTGYCNNYITCFNNMQDYSNPKCFDVDYRYDSQDGTYKYFQNGTQVLQ